MCGTKKIHDEAGKAAKSTEIRHRASIPPPLLKATKCFCFAKTTQSVTPTAKRSRRMISVRTHRALLIAMSLCFLSDFFLGVYRTVIWSICRSGSYERDKIPYDLNVRILSRLSSDPKLLYAQKHLPGHAFKWLMKRICIDLRECLSRFQRKTLFSQCLSCIVILFGKAYDLKIITRCESF
jgi:hypothetical protein